MLRSECLLLSRHGCFALRSRPDIFRDTRVRCVDDDLDHFAIRRGGGCGAHVLPLLWALIPFAVDHIRRPSGIAATAAEVVQVSENRKANAKRQDSTRNAEGATVARFVIFTEDLGAVDAGDICTHDDTVNWLDVRISGVGQA